jgi:hypothetical protein
MWLHGDRRRRRTEQPCDLPSVERHTGARLARRLLSLRRRCAPLERFGDHALVKGVRPGQLPGMESDRRGVALRNPGVQKHDALKSRACSLRLSRTSAGIGQGAADDGARPSVGLIDRFAWLAERRPESHFSARSRHAARPDSTAAA